MNTVFPSRRKAHVHTCTYKYKDANLHVKKMKMLLGPKLINGQSRTQPVQPNNMWNVQKRFPTKMPKLSTKCLKNAFYVLSLVLCGRFGDQYRRLGESIQMHVQDIKDVAFVHVCNCDQQGVINGTKFVTHRDTQFFVRNSGTEM